MPILKLYWGCGSAKSDNTRRSNDQFESSIRVYQGAKTDTAHNQNPTFEGGPSPTFEGGPVKFCAKNAECQILPRYEVSEGAGGLFPRDV
jgi:hypothetical protein